MIKRKNEGTLFFLQQDGYLQKTTYLCKRKGFLYALVIFNESNRSDMKVEEPTFVYQSQPTATRLRGQIINSVEHEEDIHALRHLWVVIEQMKKDGKNRIPKKRLSELRGVLKTAKTNKTYKEMREEYMMEKYGL